MSTSLQNGRSISTNVVLISAVPTLEQTRGKCNLYTPLLWTLHIKMMIMIAWLLRRPSCTHKHNWFTTAGLRVGHCTAGSVKLVLWRHRMHLSCMHPVTSISLHQAVLQADVNRQSKPSKGDLAPFGRKHQHLHFSLLKISAPCNFSQLPLSKGLGWIAADSSETYGDLVCQEGYRLRGRSHISCDEHGQLVYDSTAKCEGEQIAKCIFPHFSPISDFLVLFLLSFSHSLLLSFSFLSLSLSLSLSLPLSLSFSLSLSLSLSLSHSFSHPALCSSVWSIRHLSCLSTGLSVTIEWKKNSVLPAKLTA